MNRHIRASLPTLRDLALRSKYASESVETASTHFTKKAHLINLDGINCALVKESMKLGSAILKSIEAIKQEDELSSKKNRKREGRTKESMNLGKGLATGAAIASIPALAANYTINRADEKLQDNLLAIPGIAAATVGAILAARGLSPTGGKTPSVPMDTVRELENALEAREVLDSALGSTPSEEVERDLLKMSSISTDHIASLIVDILL